MAYKVAVRRSRSREASDWLPDPRRQVAHHQRDQEHDDERQPIPGVADRKGVVRRHEAEVEQRDADQRGEDGGSLAVPARDHHDARAGRAWRHRWSRARRRRPGATKPMAVGTRVDGGRGRVLAPGGRAGQRRPRRLAVLLAGDGEDLDRPAAPDQRVEQRPLDPVAPAGSARACRPRSGSRCAPGRTPESRRRRSGRSPSPSARRAAPRAPARGATSSRSAGLRRWSRGVSTCSATHSA